MMAVTIEGMPTAGTATLLWRDHKLQAGDDVTCQFGASSISSLWTVETLLASLTFRLSCASQICQQHM